MEGQIIFVGNFENVIVNITRDEFEEQRKGRSFRIVFKRDETIDRISRKLCRRRRRREAGSLQFRGIFGNRHPKGNAAGLFGLQGFSEQAQNQYLQSRLFYQTIKSILPE